MITDEKDGLDPAVKKFAESICRSESHPMLIVDKMLCCVYSTRTKLVPVGTLLSIFLKDPIETPLKKEKDTVLILDDVSYCARFIPIDKGYSLCHLLDFSAIMTMAAFTDMYSVVEQRFSLLEECSGNIRNYVGKLSEGLPLKTKLKNMQMLDLQAETNRLDFLLNGMSDYVYTALSANENNEIIDTHALVDWLVRSANTALAECGKCLDFITDVDAYYIYTNQRYAIIAILNAIQNALIYSPSADVPVVSLTKTVKNGISYVVIQIVNDLENFKGGENDSDLVSRRGGLGIPVIKKFAQRAGGEFYFKTSGSKARVGIMIPEYIPEEKDTFELESSGFSVYDYGGKNIVNIMMQDVISSVSKKKKRR